MYQASCGRAREQRTKSPIPIIKPPIPVGGADFGVFGNGARRLQGMVERAVLFFPENLGIRGIGVVAKRGNAHDNAAAAVGFFDMRAVAHAPGDLSGYKGVIHQDGLIGMLGRRLIEDKGRGDFQRLAGRDIVGAEYAAALAADLLQVKAFFTLQPDAFFCRSRPGRAVLASVAFRFPVTVHMDRSRWGRRVSVSPYANI